jgi:hypothetical protein
MPTVLLPLEELDPELEQFSLLLQPPLLAAVLAAMLAVLAVLPLLEELRVLPLPPPPSFPS